MNKQNKSQGSMEYLLILGFVLTLITIIMFALGKYLIEAGDNENKIQAQSFADNINNELSILNNAEDGYSRELVIINDDYIVNITYDTLILKDKYNDNKTYYFDLLGSLNVSIVTKLIDGVNKTVLVFEKTIVDNVDRLELIENIDSLGSVIIIAPSLSINNITSCVDLQSINNNLSANYILIQDIDCISTNTWNSGEGFIPIGNITEKFNGTFNGQGFTISNLYINRPLSDYQSIFGFVGSNIVVENVNIININVTGKSFIGGLLSKNTNFVTIKNISITGDIESKTSSVGSIGGYLSYCNIENVVFDGNIYYGDQGMVGGIAGTLTACNLTNLNTRGFVMAGISGTNEYIGGIVGKLDIRSNNFFNNINSNMYIEGSNFIGGLIGSVATNGIGNKYINNISFFGLLNGSSFVGGLIGRDKFSSNLKIENGYSISNITGNDRIGGLIGGIEFSNTVIKQSYFAGLIKKAPVGFVGGLVGFSNSQLQIYESYVESDINVTGNYIGGLVGHMSGGEIYDSYYKGNIIGKNEIGGLVGYMKYENIVNSYSIGSVVGDNIVGGFIGAFDGLIGTGVVEYLYNDFSTSNVSSTGSVKGSMVGKMFTGAMCNKNYWLNFTGNPDNAESSNSYNNCFISVFDKSYFYNSSNSLFGSWDKTNVWYFSGTDYPILKWNIPSSFSGSLSGYAWGENIGYISFNGSNYNVSVVNNQLVGYAFGENIGYISFYGGFYNVSVVNDQLIGYAWGENIGYISFNGTDYNVSIDESNRLVGYAWGENIGYIHFSNIGLYPPVILN